MSETRGTGSLYAAAPSAGTPLRAREDRVAQVEERHVVEQRHVLIRRTRERFRALTLPRLFLVREVRDVDELPAVEPGAHRSHEVGPGRAQLGEHLRRLERLRL